MNQHFGFFVSWFTLPPYPQNVNSLLYVQYAHKCTHPTSVAASIFGSQKKEKKIKQTYTHKTTMTSNEYGVAFRFYFPILHQMYCVLVDFFSIFFFCVFCSVHFTFCSTLLFLFHFRNDSIAHEIEPQQRHNNRKQFKEKQKQA